MFRPRLGAAGGTSEVNAKPLGPHELKRLAAGAAGTVTIVSSGAPILVGGESRPFDGATDAYQTPCHKGR